MFQACTVFALALVLRLVFLAQAAETEFPAQLAFLQDARYYAGWSERIAAGEWISKHSFFMGPLYAYTLAGISVLDGSSPILTSAAGAAGPVYDYQHIFLLQAVFGSLSCVLVLLLARLLLGDWQGLVAGLCCAGYGVFIYFDGLLMPSSQLLFVSLATLCTLVLAGRKQCNWLWLASGVGVGLAALAKGPSLLMLPVVWLWLAVGFPQLARMVRLRSALIVSVGCLSVVFLATAHNRAADGDSVLITANAGPNLWIGNGPSASGAHAGVTTRFESSKLDFYAFDKDRPADEPSASEVSALLFGEACEYMLEDPGRTFHLLWKKFRMFWNEVEIGTTDHFYFFGRHASVLQAPTPGFGIIVPLGIVGMFLMLRRWREFLPLQLLVASQALTFTAFFVLGRYRFASVACLIVFAVACVDWCVDAARGRRWRPLGVTALAIALAAWFVHAPIEGMGRDRGVANQLYLLARLEEDNGLAAIPAYEQALDLDWREGDLSLRQHAVARMRVGDAHARGGRLELAIAEYERALKVCEAMSPQFRYRRPLSDDIRGRIRLVSGPDGNEKKGGGL